MPKTIVSIMTMTAAMLFAVECASAAERPNVVLILSDDQGWPDYGFMGHDVIATPNLDKLSRRSLLLPRGYVTSPLCRPSLASIVTGLYPHQHGVTGNDVDGNNNRAQLDVAVRARFHTQASLIKTLVEAGYLAFQSGKWWEGSYADGGFTHGMTHGDPNRGGRHGDAGLVIGRNGMKPVTDFIDHAVERNRPFFVWYAPFLPHAPHNPPKRLLNKYVKDGRAMDVAKYYAMCEWFDETCGQLLNHLDLRGLSEDTMIVYLCDNGWSACSTNADDPNQNQWAGYALRSKGSPFEGGVRTPIMVSWPGHLEPQYASDLAQSIDLFPTIAKACGVAAPAGLPGIDLLNGDARTRRTTIFGTMHSIHNMTVGDPDDTLQYEWCVDGDWKLLVRHHGRDTTNYVKVHQWDHEPVRLYNLADDPHERKNLADERPEIVQQLRSKLQSWRTDN